jgi:voltage-gated potassium channel
MERMRNKNIKHAYIAMGLLLFTILVGTIGYILLGFTPTEAIYQTIITMATVGFEEVHPLSETGMWFTSFLVIFSFGIFAYAVTMFTRYMVEGIFTKSLKDNKVKRRIDKLQNHVILCGYGRNGTQAAHELYDHKIPVVIIEQNAEIIDELRKAPNILFVEGDAANEDVLIQANIKSARAMITTLPVDADNLFVVLTAKGLNPDLKIISRASMDHSDVKLKRAGAYNVIMPDKIGGKRMAKLVAQPDIVEFIDYILLQSAKNVVLEEISCEKLATCFAGKSIRELDIRNETGANIIGMKREDNSYLINPNPETVLTSSDKLFALGTKAQITMFRKTIETGNPQS